MFDFSTVGELKALLDQYDPDTLVAIVDYNNPNTGALSGPSGPGCNYSGCDGQHFIPVTIDEQRGWDSRLRKSAEQTPVESRTVLIIERDWDRNKVLLPKHLHH